MTPKHFRNAFFMATAMLFVQASSQLAKADQYPCNLTPNLVGPYAFQFNGNILLPPPFDKYNGPFFRNGRVVADGNGNLQTTTVVANYAGTVARETFAATYVVRADGTFTITIQNLPVPAFPPGTPNTFTFDGVFFNCSNSAKVVLSGVSLFGMPQLNIGSVISGEFIRQ